jgi:hypothetical protein
MKLYLSGHRRRNPRARARAAPWESKKNDARTAVRESE